VRWITVSALLCLLLLAVPATASTAAPRTVPASVVAATLRQGKSVQLSGAVVEGMLDLTSTDVVRGFACTGCTFLGGIVASGAVFRAAVDLSHSRIRGPLRLHGARFIGKFLLGSPERPAAKVEGAADFSLATFQATANFNAVGFAGVNYTQASFLGQSSFDNATISGTATFDGAEFTREARFAGATVKQIRFYQTIFSGGADFRYAQIRGGGIFFESDFNASADFTHAEFERGVSFGSARFRRGADFGSAVFVAPEGVSLLPDLAASADFDSVTSGGSLGFVAAIFMGDALFNGVACAGSLSFARASFRRDFQGEDIQAHDFRLPIDAVSRALPSERPALLRLIETSAKNRGDFGAANDAYYQLQILNSSTYSWPARTLDLIFYRGAAGYLVRPEHPLLALLLLALLFSTLSTYRARTTRTPTAAWARKGRLGAGFRFTLAVGDGVVHRVTAAVPKRFGGGANPERQPVRATELTVYRILLLCALIALSANPAFRQLLDLLR
jgi:uncharacterized protein YjbI with pentapeptide repeats